MEIQVVYHYIYIDEMELYHLYDGSLSAVIAFTLLRRFEDNDMDAHAGLIFVLLVVGIRWCIRQNKVRAHDVISRSCIFSQLQHIPNGTITQKEWWFDGKLGPNLTPASQKSSHDLNQGKTTRPLYCWLFLIQHLLEFICVYDRCIIVDALIADR